MRRRARAIALLATLLMVAAACGQKDGVHVASGGGGGSGDLSFAEGGATGDALTGDAGATDAGAAAGGASGAAAGGSTGAAGGAAGTGAAAASGGGAAAASGPVWGDTITLGIHAPITGAAPLPSSFAAAAKLYPDYINGKGGINGRKVEAVVVDDKYTPSTASQVCTEMIKQKNAFLVIGGGGTDQIQACARTSASFGVPYLSAGVTEVGLRGLKNYFAVSMSYVQQGPFLANFIKQKFGATPANTAMVYSDTPNFEDARDAFVKAMGNVKIYKLSRNPSQSELANAARDMCASGMKVVYPLMAPTNWLYIAGQSNTLCRGAIQWSGVGLTMGLNTIASTGCRAGSAVDKATFFSPFPGVDKAPSMDPEFAAAVQGKSWDDIYVALWTTSKAIGKLLEASGKDLSRAKFVSTVENTKNLTTGMAPVLSFTPSDHFGAHQVHVLQADCAAEQYKTIATFATY
jgi:ABC-type branched-subunit amino acid transport system substrate-binding protein